MPTIPETLIEINNGDGTTSPLPGVSVKVFKVSSDADVATVTTDSDGYFAATSVSGSAGDLFRLRIENYHGRAGYYEIQSV